MGQNEFAVLNRSLADEVVALLRGAIQQGLNLGDLQSLKVFVANDVLQARIAKVHQLATFKKAESITALEQAESTLLDALGIKNWQAPEPLSYIRPSNSAFLASNSASVMCPWSRSFSTAIWDACPWRDGSR